MNYIELQTIYPSWAAAVGWIGLGIFLFLSTAITVRAEKKSSMVGRVIGYFMILPAVGSLILAVGSSIPDRTTQRDSFVERVKAEYGIELSNGEARDLYYPGKLPTAEFETFGSFERMLPGSDGGYELNRIFLLWENGELKLAKSTDGENFSELKADS